MVSFIVLHYGNIDDTIKCLDSIKNTFNKEKYSIVVVDNNTLDKNSKNEIEKYTSDIILLDKNYGFAKANNIGSKYAIKKYNPDFLCVINNDVFITQSDFINIIKSDYEKYNFDLLGPFIDSPMGYSYNPFPVIYNKDDIINSISESKKIIKIYSNIFTYNLLKLCIKIKHVFIKKQKFSNGKKMEIGCALHGCAIIFSKKYYKKYNGNVFYDNTFLYHEEEFIYDRIIKDKLISVYDPNLKVYHNEGSSLNKKYNARNARIFREKEIIKSLRLLLKKVYGESD